MPASMSIRPDAVHDLTQDDLSNRVIELLYQIIEQAQTLHSHSAHALSDAFESICHDQGTESEEEYAIQRVLSVVLKRDGANWLQRLDDVLGDLGLSVERDEDGEGVDITASSVNATAENIGQHNARYHRLERSGSFDSFFGGSADKIAGPSDGRLGLPIRSRVSSFGQEIDGELQRRQARRAQSDARALLHARLPRRPKANNSAQGLSGVRHLRSRPRAASVSSIDDLPTRAGEVADLHRSARSDTDESGSLDQTEDHDFADVQIPGVNSPIPTGPRQVQAAYAPKTFRPSDTRLFEDAETFAQQRLHAYARKALQTWSRRTKEWQNRFAEQISLAVAHDSNTLIKQSLENWLYHARKRRADRETDRFFDHLERRAARARNLFLLTKAFTHWAQSAEDEVQRTSVARRHILRTRFFNGWREITAVNEMKVQHFVLAKYLRRWRLRAEDIRMKEDLAYQTYDERLLRTHWHTWFFGFLDLAAPGWHNERLKISLYRRWHEITNILREREIWVEIRKETQLLRSAFQHWKARANSVGIMVSQAERQRAEVLKSTALSRLIKCARFAPLLKGLRSRADARQSMVQFTVWRRNTQLSQQARNVDHMRLLRNAWTAWNDNLRIKALEQRIDDRILVETLYKWALASRVSLFQRVHDRNVKETVFSQWLILSSERSNSLEEAERQFFQFKRCQLLSSYFKKMASISAVRTAEGQAMRADYDLKLKERIFDRLVGKHEHLQQMQRWSIDARFYVLATRTLKICNAATRKSKKNRRRELYGQMRRTVKVNLVKNTFQIWREKSKSKTVMKEQADAIEMQRSHVTTWDLLMQWAQRAQTLTEAHHQAQQSREVKLRIQYFDTWYHRLENYQGMDSQAAALSEESTEVAAAYALKKLGWRLWNVRRREEDASALHQRNFEKHRRAMIRFWHEQASERVRERSVSPTPQSRLRLAEEHTTSAQGVAGTTPDRVADVQEETSIFDRTEEPSRELEGWSAFDAGVLGASELDLSFSMTPQINRISPAPTSTSRRRSVRQARTLAHAPKSILRNKQPSPIPEDPLFNDSIALITSTPMPPMSSKPGYLRTPSRRSVARNKRSELPASPEKRLLERQLAVGVASAPPGLQSRALQEATGLTSFQRRLQEGGFSRSARDFGGASGREVKGRVVFGDVNRVGR